MRRISILVRNLLHRKRVEKDLDEEIRSYMAMSVELKTAEGMSEQEANRMVRLDTGGVDRVKEAVRDVRLGMMIQQLFQDVQYAARTLRRSPGFATVHSYVCARHWREYSDVQFVRCHSAAQSASR